jgi:hypothetical protein
MKGALKIIDDGLSKGIIVDDSKNDFICFNGIGEDSCENFYLKSGRDFAFCKTRRSPYDIYVVAILCLVDHFDLAKVSSDGDLEDWQPGIDLAKEITGLDIGTPKFFLNSRSDDDA